MDSENKLTQNIIKSEQNHYLHIKTNNKLKKMNLLLNASMVQIQ
jgi:hypothetical protein